MQAEAWMKDFFTGINYWGSKDAIHMWSHYDAASVEEDLRALQSAGITILRVFPLWPVFQPLHALYTTQGVFEYRFGEDPLPDTPAGRAGVSEEACLHFASFCDLAEKYGMKLVVGLITGQMSFRVYAPPAFAGKQLLTDPTVIKWQLRFVKYFVTRFKGHPAIAGWDLGNEVNTMATGPDFQPDSLYVWCAAIGDAVRACDGTHPVISGMDNSSVAQGPANLAMIRDTCDIHTTHPYNIFATAADPLPTMKPILDLAFKCALAEGVAGIPTFVQEFGSIGYMNCSRKTEADFYRAALYTAFSHDCHGVMWWCAFDQGHLRYAPYDWNNIGSDYGFFDRDRTEKPLVAENLRFRELLKKLPGGLPRHRQDGVVLIPRDDGDADRNTLRAAFLLAKRANLDLGFSYALDPIPDAPLYLLPSLSRHKSITGVRLDELLRKVKAGAVLYLSVGEALVRQLPEFTGVQIAWRACAPVSMNMTLAGETLPLAAPVRFTVESADAEILARDETGAPLFFRHAYGKGQVYLLLSPLESDLAGRQGAFYAEDEPAYDAVYRLLSKAAGIARAADSASPFIRLTEHPLDKNSGYLVAINYSPVPRTARIDAPGVRLLPIHGANLQAGRLTLKENDGAIFRYERITESGAENHD